MFWVFSDLSITGWVVIILAIIVAYSFVTRSPWQRLPPGPPCFPLIGSLPYLGGDIRDVFSKMAAKYGNIFMIKMGLHRVVVLNGLETIKEAFLKSKLFHGRSDMWHDLDGGYGVAEHTGELFKVQKNFVQQTMRDLNLGERSVEMLIQDEVRQLASSLKGFSGAPYNPQPLIQKAVANVIAVILFGQRYDYQDPAIAQLIHDVVVIHENVGVNNLALLFKWLRYLPGDLFGYHKAKSLLSARYSNFEGDVKLREDDPQCQDLIAKYIKQIPQWNHLDDYPTFRKHLTRLIMSVFAGGTDTATNTLLWAILYLVLDPDIQSKVRHEIDDVIGPDRLPSMQDRLEMPYTEAVISEAQRIGDVVPMGVPHATTDDADLAGFTIPKGTMVLANLHSVHWDSQLYPQPEQFDPRRFLDDDGKYKKRSDLMPFCIGKLSCLGENLAKMELFIFLTSLLQTFTFSLPPNQPKPNPDDGILGLTHHAKDYDVIMQLR